VPRARKRPNGAPTPVPSSAPDLAPIPTAEELRRRIVEIKQKQAALDQERETRCLAAWRGSEEAKNRIDAIDNERRALQSERKTAQTILNHLQVIEQQERVQAQIEGKRRDFERNRPLWSRQVKVRTIERWENVAWHIETLMADGRFDEARAHWLGQPLPHMPRDHQTPVSPVDVPHAFAQGFVDPICLVRKVVPDPGKPGMLVYSDEIDTALRDEFVGTLITEAKLPALPTTLGAFITKYRKKSRPIEESRTAIHEPRPDRRTELLQQELPPPRM